MFDQKTPVVLVARGCLAPYFLSWWRAQPNLLYVIDFSRWRWFENGNPPTWIGERAPAGRVVLFDRNTTTGQTLRLLKHWLTATGYDPTVLAHMDRAMGAFGIQFTDYVWDDGGGYDRLGLSCSSGEVSIISREEYLQKNSLGGCYTFAVVGGERPELGGVDCPPLVHVRLAPTVSCRSVVYQRVPDWQTAMILGYTEQKPLITIAGAAGVVADYGWDEPLTDITSFLAKEVRCGNTSL